MVYHVVTRGTFRQFCSSSLVVTWGPRFGKLHWTDINVLLKTFYEYIVIQKNMVKNTHKSRARNK